MTDEPTTVDEARISEMRFWLGEREGADVALAYELMGSHENLRAALARSEADYQRMIRQNKALNKLNAETYTEWKGHADKAEAQVATLREQREAIYRERVHARTEVATLREAAVALLEQIEIEIGPCDGSENSSLWPTANGMRAALASTDQTGGNQ